MSELLMQADWDRVVFITTMACCGAFLVVWDAHYHDEGDDE